MESVGAGDIAKRHQKRSFVHSRPVDIAKLAIDVVSEVNEQKKSASIDPRAGATTHQPPATANVRYCDRHNSDMPN